eukprot:7894067-Alexandrium_andersonii.AAC.1
MCIRDRCEVARATCRVGEPLLRTPCQPLPARSRSRCSERELRVLGVGVGQQRCGGLARSRRATGAMAALDLAVNTSAADEGLANCLYGAR